MKSLFIDTSTRDLTIAISSTDEIFYLNTFRNTNEHSKYALKEIEDAFSQTAIKPDEIDKIYVINGPGSFTGVRIGVTIAKTYAWTLNKEVVPISSLLAHAVSYDGFDYYISVLDARRDHVYAAIYNENYESVLDEQYISIEKLNEFIMSLKGKIVMIGDIEIDEYENMPIKMDVLKIIKHCQNDPSISSHSLKPRYLKLVEAEEKLMGVSK